MDREDPYDRRLRESFQSGPSAPQNPPQERPPDEPRGDTYEQRRRQRARRGLGLSQPPPQQQPKRDYSNGWERDADRDASGGEGGGYPGLQKKWVPEIQRRRGVTRQEAEGIFNNWFKRRMRADHPMER